TATLRAGGPAPGGGAGRHRTPRMNVRNALADAGVARSRKSPFGSRTSYQTRPRRAGNADGSVDSSPIQPAFAPPALVDPVSAIQNGRVGASAWVSRYTSANRDLGSVHASPPRSPKL